jgi:hypothetical protein
MRKNTAAERRGFYRAIHRAIAIIEQANHFDACDDCHGEGIQSDESVCGTCSGFGDPVIAQVRSLKYDDQDGTQEARKSLQENFCPEDPEQGAKLAIATTVLEQSDPSVVVAWMLANASVVIRNNPSVLESDECAEWAAHLAEEIESAKSQYVSLPMEIGEA